MISNLIYHSVFLEIPQFVLHRINRSTFCYNKSFTFTSHSIKDFNKKKN